MSYYKTDTKSCEADQCRCFIYKCDKTFKAIEGVMYFENKPNPVIIDVIRNINSLENTLSLLWDKKNKNESDHKLIEKKLSTKNSLRNGLKQLKFKQDNYLGTPYMCPNYVFKNAL